MLVDLKIHFHGLLTLSRIHCEYWFTKFMLSKKLFGNMAGAQKLNVGMQNALATLKKI